MPTCAVFHSTGGSVHKSCSTGKFVAAWVTATALMPLHLRQQLILYLAPRVNEWIASSALNRLRTVDEDEEGVQMVMQHAVLLAQTDARRLTCCCDIVAEVEEWSDSAISIMECLQWHKTLKLSERWHLRVRKDYGVL